MPIKYIGRTTSFRGKSLWEILANLKNFGVGRMVVRSMFERYPEPSYMRVIQVEGMENEPSRKVCVSVEKVFRGKKLPGVTKILKTSYKTDYRLIPKDEENDYVKGLGREERMSTSTYSMKRVLPQEMLLPPLILELNKAAVREKGKLDEVPRTIPLLVRQGPANRAILVPDACLEESVLVEEPDAPRLYQGLK